MQTAAALNGLDNKQRVWVVRALAVAFVIGLLALATPLIWAAVSAGTGLAALMAIAAMGTAAFHAMPLAMQKLENRLLAARKAEARRNPIEQLQNEMLRRSERLKSFRKALVTVGGKIESIAQMIAEHRHRDPEFELDRQQRALHRLQQFHGVNLKRLGRAQEALEEFKLTIERKESEWTIAVAIGDANDLLDPHASDNLMRDLLTDTALREVQERFNYVFAELDVQMSSPDNPTHALLDAPSLDRMDAFKSPRRHRVGSEQ